MVNTAPLKSRAMHYGYYFETPEEKEKKGERNLKPLLELFEKNPTDARTIYHIAQEYEVAGNHKARLKYLEMIPEVCGRNYDHNYYQAARHQLACCYFMLEDFEATVDSLRDYFDTVPQVLANACHLKHLECHVLGKLERYDEAAEAGVKAFEYLKMKESGKLNPAILGIVVVRTLTEEMIVADIVSNYTLAGNFEGATKWASKNDDSNDDIFTTFATVAARNAPENLCKIYSFVAANYPLGSPAYEKAVSVLESHITTATIKAKVAAKFLDYQDMGDGYVYLWQLRHHMLNEDSNLQARTMTENFLRLTIALPQHFADVMYAAIKLGVNFTPFLSNLQITNSAELAMRLISTNEKTGELLLAYLKQHSPEKAKALRIVSAVLFMLCSKNLSAKEPEVIKNHLAYFEAYVRIRDKYLRTVHFSEFYNETAVDNLPERDAFVHFAACAYAKKDEGDSVAYVKNLRTALRICPEEKETITILIENLQREIAPPRWDFRFEFDTV
jgi:tetratricopeptide (TPR) repeat protein